MTARKQAAQHFGRVCAKHPELKGERCVSGGMCKACKRGNHREWRGQAENREKEREANQKRYAANREMFIERARKRQAGNPERHREYCRKYRRVNLETARESSRKWARANPAALAAGTAVRRARKGNATPLTAIDRARIQEFYNIAAARYAQTGIKWHVDHDVPLAQGGKHHPDNLILLPAAINLAKGARFGSTMDFILS